MKKMVGLFTVLMALSIMLCMAAFAAAPGRPVVEDGTLKTASHELLRTGVAWYGKCYPDPTGRTEDPLYWQRAKDVGLNGIRVTNWDQRSYRGTFPADGATTPCGTDVDSDGVTQQTGTWSINDNIDHLKTMVANADAAGMYVIITPGDTPGSFSQTYLTDFWTLAADEFKNNTNVVFEITNEPVAWGPGAYTNTHLNNLATIYNIMRSLAPNTPILSLSFSHADEDMRAKSVYFANPARANITWSNNLDVISFHTYGTPNLTHVNNLRNGSPSIPVMNTEWNYPEYNDGAISLAGNKFQGQALEQSGISWENFQAGRADGEFTRYYDFVNDAKLKDYFWILPDSYSTGLLGYKDDLADLTTHVYSASANMQIAAGNPPYFNGDANRATRSDTNPGYIIYKAPGLGKFKAHIYSHNSYNGIKFYISRNGTVWEQIAVTRSASVATSGGWAGAYYTSTNAFPSGTEYLKVELSSTSASYDTQIADMVIANWSTVWEVEDNLNAFSVADTNNNMTFATANPANFGGDGSRAKLTSAGTGYVTYKLDNFSGFYAKVFFKNTNPITSPGTIVFSSSPDGINWTAISATYDSPEATANGWKGSFARNTNSLASGTKYIKVEFTDVDTQLGEIRYWVKY
jgi:hypothetical protein